LTDESATPDGRGRYNHFENGSIYWTNATGAHEVDGDIQVVWAAAGWEQGPLGYPIDGPKQMMPSSGPTDFQDFEHGSVYDWLGQSRTILRSPSVVALSATIIDWTQFGSRLPDGGEISVSFNGHPPNGATRVTLEAGPGVSWWKGISLWSPSLGDRFEVWTQDRQTTMTVSVPVSELEQSNVFLNFMKAKMFGVHTGVYALGRADRLIGNDVTFRWMRD
jgi:LGFP repeat